MWRPKGWSNPFPYYRDAQELEELTKLGVVVEGGAFMWEAYEAGAQAMLEALRAMGVVGFEPDSEEGMGVIEKGGRYYARRN